MSNSSNLYTIGQLSKLCNVPIQTLRFYDKEGLLKPESRDYENQYRYYSEKQLLQLLVIRELKSIGFNLDDIKRFILHKDLNIFPNKLEEKTVEIINNIKKLNMQLQQALENYNRVKNGLNILKAYNEIGSENVIEKNNVEVTLIPECLVVYTNYRSKYNANELFLERVAELMAIRDKYQLYSHGPLTAVFHDHYTAQFLSDTCCFELCIPIIEENKECPNIRKFGGFYGASTIYVGGYKDMLVAYLSLVKWIENYGYKITGPAMEQYIIEPQNTDYEKDYVTKIIFPIEIANTDTLQARVRDV